MGWRVTSTRLSALLLCAAAAAPAAHADSVYVTNHFGGSVSQYDAGAGGALAAKPQGPVAAGTNPIGLGVSPDGRSVYVANNGSANISQYDVADDGTLVPKSPPTVPAGTGPSAIAVSPDGKNVYVTNASDSSVSQYTVGGGGALVPKTPAAVAAGAVPFGIAVSPDSASAYITNSVISGTVSQYDIDTAGRLVAKAPATVPAGMNPIGVAVNGASVYVANGGGSNISQYDVGAGGTLSAKAPATVAAGQSPYGMAVSHDGQSVYVTNQGADSQAGGEAVSQYDVGAGGGLAPKTPASVPSPETPRGVAMSTDGASVYVPHIHTADVGQFNVGSGGALFAKSPAAVGAGSGADAVAVSPIGPAPPPGDGRPPPGPPGVTLLELTRITSGPSGLTPSLPTFTFDSPALGAAATFQCRFDNRPFQPCTSPHTGYGLSRGAHTFEVRAIDSSGTPDPTPASRNFRLGRVTTRGQCSFIPDWDRYVAARGQPKPPQSCITLQQPCPNGSECSVRGTADITSEDGLIVWQGQWRVAIEGPNSDLTRPDRISNLIYNWCLTNAMPNSQFSCPTSIGPLSWFGRDDSVTGTCSVPFAALAAERPVRGDDEARRLTCTSTYTVDPAPILRVTGMGGASAGIFLASAGTLTVTGTRAGSARAAARAKPRPRSAVRTTRVKAKAAGPLRFKLRLTPAAKKTLKRKRSLKLSLKLTFVAADGTRTARTQKLTLKEPKQVRRRPRKQDLLTATRGER